MKINQSNLLNQLAADQLKQKDNQKGKYSTESRNNVVSTNFKDIYQASANSGATFSYNNRINLNSIAIDQLMQEGEDIHNSVGNLIRDFLERQNISVDQLKNGEIDNIEVDEITQEKAQQLIGPGGELSPEKVSDRIVNFAIAGFGGDRSKIDIIRSSIDRGFVEAEHMLGELSDVSKQTYDLIQQKLDNWMNEEESTETENT